MNEIPWVDGGLIFIVVLSCIIGFIRGFTREFLGLLSWGGSLFGALYLYPYGLSFIHKYIQSLIVAGLVSGVFIFCLFFFCLSILSKGISTKVKSSVLSGFDRTLGLLFGILRGWLFLGIVFIGGSFFLPFSQWPQATKQGKIVPLSALSAQFILESLPKSLPRLVSLRDGLTRAIAQLETPIDMSVGRVSQLSTVSLQESSPQTKE